jgi:diaminopimelate decarboxylase
MGQSVLTGGIRRVDGSLHVEGVALDAIARAVGTPAYVYSSATIRDRFAQLDAALSRVPHRIHYTAKANSNSAVLRLVRALGAGVDVVSGGELHRALRAGFPGSDIIFGGVGKTAAELRYALEQGVLLINVESEAEVHLIDEIARGLGVVAPISIRVNPELTLETSHAYIKTGERGQKFGIPYDDVIHVALVAAALPCVRLVGIDMHLGSQLSRIDPYVEGTARLAALCDQLRARGIDTLRFLDIGGGLGVRYDTEQLPDLPRFADTVVPLVEETGLTLLMEPGRFLVGNAGVLLTRVLYRKHSGGKDYVIVDAGMTELLRPSHYNAFHRVEAVDATGDDLVADVVGPVCESGDFLALDRSLPDVAPGELLAVHDVGAYGYVMASNYNSRPRSVEVLVDEDRFAVTTARESYDDLTRLDIDTLEWRS